MSQIDEIKATFPEVEWKIQDSLFPPEGSIQEYALRLKQANQPVFIQFSGVYNSVSVIDGIIDHVGPDFLAFRGVADDIVLIPFGSINILRIYNPELDAAIQEKAMAEAKQQQESDKFRSQLLNVVEN